MKLPRGVHAVLRGPVRTRWRGFQARHPLPLGSVAPGLPDFVGIGAQRCGTSWWHSLLAQHPQVAGLGLGAKELHFFDDFWQRSVSAQDRWDYASHFRRRRGQVAGEWTPRYLFDPWAVPALLEIAPSTKLIVILRDPVARFRSGLRHDIDVASGRALTPDAVTSAYTRGLYAHQLEPVLALVPREQVLVLQLEQCVRDVPGFLGRTWEFLGLEPVSASVAGQRNESRAPAPVPQHLIDRVRPRYRSDAERLAGLLPDVIDLDLWTGLHPSSRRGT